MHVVSLFALVSLRPPSDSAPCFSFLFYTIITSSSHGYRSHYRNAQKEIYR